MSVLAYLSKTISTLCRDIAVIHDHADHACVPASYDDVTEFVLEQLRKMPTFLSWPILLATAVFGVRRFLLEKSFLHKRTQKQPPLQVESWRHSSFRPRRDLIKFYTSLIVLVLYSRRQNGTRETAGDG
jgi:hypothetical protein